MKKLEKFFRIVALICCISLFTCSAQASAGAHKRAKEDKKLNTKEMKEAYQKELKDNNEALDKLVANSDIYENHLNTDGFKFSNRRNPATGMAEYFTVDQVNFDGSSIDLRWIDCKTMNQEQIDKVKAVLPRIVFNEDTKFTKDLKKLVNAKDVLKKGKNPGLGIRALHKKGITGKGVGIAIIDQPLYLDHPEYAKQLKSYEEIQISKDECGSMHGAAVSSIAVGKDCGVAPDSNLYYWAFNFTDWFSEAKGYLNFYNGFALIIDRIIDYNKVLPEDSKIRVISISRGWMPQDDIDNWPQLKDACKRATENGIFVLPVGCGEIYDFIPKDSIGYFGAGINSPFLDYDDEKNYGVCDFAGSNYKASAGDVLIPIDYRTTADMSGDTYVNYNDGGMSWGMPYLAGVYALCAQVYPEITPEDFYKEAVNTAYQVTAVEDNNITVPIINPTGLVEAFQKKK